MSDVPIDIDLARDSLGHLTTVRAVNYLAYTFDAGIDEILDLSEEPQRGATTPLELGMRLAAGSLASHVSIIFWGGPPGDEAWYPGSLLDMLIDRLFFNKAVGNNEIVNRFLRACR